MQDTNTYLNQSDDKSFLKIIGTTVYIGSLFYLIVLLSGIFGSIYVKHTIFTVIYCTSISVFTIIWIYIVKIKSIHYKIIIAGFIFLFWMFALMIFSNGVYNPVFPIDALMGFTLVLVARASWELLLYFFVIFAQMVYLYFDPKYNSVYFRSATEVSLWTIALLAIVIILFFSQIYKKISLQYEKEMAIKLKNEDINRSKNEFLKVSTEKLQEPITKLQDSINQVLQKYHDKLNTNMQQVLTKANTNAMLLKNLSVNMLQNANTDIENVEFKIEKLNLSEIINDALSYIELKAKEKNISISYIKSQNIEIKADKNRIEEVLRNILDNAVKYTNNNGRVILEERDTEDIVSIIVSDNGIGIPSKDISKLFQKYYRASNVASNTSQGTGQGLYLIKEYVEKMGGTIKIESTEGIGTSVTVEILKWK